MNNMFVYGTLRKSDQKKAALKGASRLRYASLPGIELGVDGEVEGRIKVIDSEQELNRLDRYESTNNKLYKRVVTNNGYWVYAPNPARFNFEADYTWNSMDSAAQQTEVELLD